MSDVSNDFEAHDDISEVGTTSGEVVTQEAPKASWYEMDIFNMMLLVSFVLITLASMLMIWHLIDRYGSISDLPWNV